MKATNKTRIEMSKILKPNKEAFKLTIEKKARTLRPPNPKKTSNHFERLIQVFPKT